MASTMAVVPTFRKVATSDRLASPTITWSRRYFWLSQCGSSRVLTIGPLQRGLEPDLLLEEVGPLGELERHLLGRRRPGASQPTLPAPQKIWRVTKCGVIWATMRPKGTSRAMR